MDEQAKTIIALFAILICLTAVAVLKVTGVFDKEELATVNTNYVEYSAEELIALAEDQEVKEELQKQEAKDEAKKTAEATEQTGNIISATAIVTDEEGNTGAIDIKNILEDEAAGKSSESDVNIVNIAIIIFTAVVTYLVYKKMGVPNNKNIWELIGPISIVVISFLEIPPVIILVWIVVIMIFKLIVMVEVLHRLQIDTMILYTMIGCALAAIFRVPIIAAIARLTLIGYIVMFIYLYCRNMARMFNKGPGFAVALFFFHNICLAILAFDPKAKTNYTTIAERTASREVGDVDIEYQEDDDEDDFLEFEEIDGEKVSEKIEDVDEFDELEEMTKVEEEKIEESVDLPVFSRVSKSKEDKVEEEVNDLPVFSKASKEDKKTIEEVEEIESIEELEELEKIKAVEEDKMEEESDLPVFSRISKSTDNKK